MRSFFFFSLLVISTSNLFAQESGLFTPEKRKAFADYLFCEKDYLRAAEEYEAINEINKNDSLAYRVGLCFLKMNDYAKAGDLFYQLKNSLLGEESRLLYAKTSFLLKKNFIDKENFEKKELKTSFARLQLALQIKGGINYSNLPDPDNCFDENEAEMMKNFAEHFARPQRKSPTAAAIFSMIIPGAGKIYTRDYSDGITSFLVSGLFTFLSYDNFRAKHNTRGWIFTGLTAFFYSGNVYGSYISARNYNREKEEELNSEYESYLSSKNYFVPEEIEGKCK